MELNIFSGWIRDIFSQLPYCRCQLGACRDANRVAARTDLLFVNTPGGPRSKRVPAWQEETSKVLKQSQRAIPTCHSSHGQKLPWHPSSVSKTSVSSEEETQIHFPPSGRLCPHFCFPRFFWFSYPHMWSKNRETETEATMITTLWVGAFPCNRCLQGGLVQKGGRANWEKAICLQVRAKHQLMKEMKPRGKPWNRFLPGLSKASCWFIQMLLLENQSF